MNFMDGNQILLVIKAVINHPLKLSKIPFKKFFFSMDRLLILGFLVLVTQVHAFEAVQSKISNSKHARYLLTFKNSNHYRKLTHQFSNIQADNKSVVSLSVVPELGLSNVNINVENNLDHLNSLVVSDLTNESAEQLAQSPFISSIEKEEFFPINDPVTLPKRQLDNEMPAMSTNNDSLNSPGQPWGIKAINAPEAWNESYGGKGARVLVIDSGIDRGHPAISANFEQGENFISPDDEAPNRIVEYSYQDTDGHGTHVAGTIAGVLTNRGFSGVAPKATLLSARVCSHKGCSNIAITQAINWALDKNIDVINMSLGGGLAYPSQRLAIKKAYAQNIVIVTASGNNGTNKIDYPGALRECLPVGAVNKTLKRGEFSQYGPELTVVAPGVDVLSSIPRGTGTISSVSFKIGDGFYADTKNIFWGGGEGRSALSGELVFAGLGKKEDFSSVSVEGKIVLIQRGEIKFSEKVKNAVEAKAAAVILFNNEPGFIGGVISENKEKVPVSVFMIEQKAGEDLRKTIENKITTFAKYELIRTDYMEFQGTSMASPHVAGVVALMKAVNKSISPAQVRDLLMKTATPIKEEISKIVQIEIPKVGDAVTPHQIKSPMVEEPVVGGQNPPVAIEAPYVNPYGAGLVNAELAVKAAINIKSEQNTK